MCAHVCMATLDVIPSKSAVYIVALKHGLSGSAIYRQPVDMLLARIYMHRPAYHCTMFIEGLQKKYDQAEIRDCQTGLCKGKSKNINITDSERGRGRYIPYHRPE